MNKTVVILVICLAGLLAGGGYGYAILSGELKSAKQEAAHEKELRKINVKNSTLSSVTKFVFSEVTNQYTYYFDTNFVTWFTQTWGGDRVQIVYEWPYTFSFGIELPEQWNWCVKVLKDKPGFVSVNSPKPSFLYTNPPNPTPAERGIINAPSHAVNDATVKQQMDAMSLQRVKEDAQQYLQDSYVQKNITLSFSKHIQEIMNLSHPHSNPVAGVDINYVDDNTCE